MATTERRTVTIEEAARMLGVSRGLAYYEARSGSLAGVPVLRVGHRKLLSRARLEAVLDGREQESGA